MAGANIWVIHGVVLSQLGRQLIGKSQDYTIDFYSMPKA